MILGSGPRFQQRWGRILAWGGETHIMVPGQLSLSEREQNQRADCRLQEETAAALHSSYDQWDPCGEGEQLQVPRCKHLRGPDLDCTHPNTGQESQARLYHLRQLRKFRVSPAILKTFYSGAIESVLTQCISVWYNNATNQDCKALQRVVRLAERISGSTLPSLQDIYLKRCKSRGAKIIKDSNHPGNHHFCLLPSGKRFRSKMAKNWKTEEEFLPSGHQAPKLSLITPLHPQDSI